ncbi:hypothetical protein DITRI_Ditri08aG0016900 [Diplodiscus trichospermus]
MISCLCKTLFSIRVAAVAVAATVSVAVSKDLNFLQNSLPLIPASNRYYGSTNAADQHLFVVSYLMNSFGLSPESSLRVSKCVHFEIPEKADAFLSLLKNHGSCRNMGCLVPEPYATTVCFNYPLIFIVKHDKFKAVVEEVKKPGFDPLKYAFLDAIYTLVIGGKSWESKFSLDKKWGWSDEEIWSAFWKIPKIMMISQCNINAKIDFYVNEKGYKSQHFAKHPIFFFGAWRRELFLGVQFCNICCPKV